MKTIIVFCWIALFCGVAFGDEIISVDITDSTTISGFPNYDDGYEYGKKVMDCMWHMENDVLDSNMKTKKRKYPKIYKHTLENICRDMVTGNVYDYLWVD